MQYVIHISSGRVHRADCPTITNNRFVSPWDPDRQHLVPAVDAHGLCLPGGVPESAHTPDQTHRPAVYGWRAAAAAEAQDLVRDGDLAILPNSGVAYWAHGAWHTVDVIWDLG